MDTRSFSAGLAALALFAPLAAGAATTVLTVDTAAQRGSPGDLPTNCTLGDALVAANLDHAEDGCTHPNLGSGGPFEIVLPAGMAFVLGASEAAGTGGSVGLPVVSARVSVRGNGNAIERDAALACPDPGGANFRILEVAGSGQLTLEGVVLRNGCAPSGGGVFNTGLLTLRNGGLEGNTAYSGNGGGLANASGTVNVVGSRVASNSASGMGGGLYHFGDAPLVVDRTSIVYNAAGTGGGIQNVIGRITLVNTTVSNNEAARSGAFENSGGGRITLISSTVAANRATVENPGIVNRVGQMSFVNTVLGNPCVFLSSPGVTDAGHNVERRDTCGLVAPSSIRNAVPLLDPLGVHGGPTESHPLQAGSPALDAGDDAVCAGPGVGGVDQRGVARPDGDAASGGHCDVGAVERVDCDGNGTDDGVEIGADPTLDADGSGVLDACENHPPVANAGLDQSLECASADGAMVDLDGTGSWDPDGDALVFAWTGPFGSADGAAPAVSLPLGIHAIGLTVADESGSAASDEVAVAVGDSSAPTAQASLEQLGGVGGWNRLRVHAACADTCDGAPVMSAMLDGVAVADGDVVTLRAVGRSATPPVLSVSCTDASGNVSTAEAVPPQRPGGGPAEACRALLEKFVSVFTRVLDHLLGWLRR